MTGLRFLFGPSLLNFLKHTPIQIPATLLLRGQNIFDWRCCLQRRMSLALGQNDTDDPERKSRTGRVLAAVPFPRRGRQASSAVWSLTLHFGHIPGAEI
jgi:hypothetical protein